MQLDHTRHLTPVEVARVLQAARSAEWRDWDLHDVLLFLAGTGVRLGEALALHWPDLDLDGNGAAHDAGLPAGRAWVHTGGHTLVRVRGEGIARVAHGSTKRGERWLALPTWLASALAARWESRRNGVIVFPNTLELDQYRDVSHVTKKLRQLLDGVEGEDGEPLTWASSHAFRRTVVTTAHDLGVVDRQIAGQTGHRSTDTMRRWYVAQVRASTLAAHLLVDDPTALVDEAGYRPSAKPL